MKVLQINSVCGRGSTGRIVVALHDALHARGEACRVIYGRGAHPSEVNAHRIGTPLSTGMHAALSRVTDRQGFYSARPTRQLIAEIKRLRPDLIHLHNLHGYYLNLPILFRFLQQSAIPIIWTLHDCWPLTGHCAYFDVAGCDKWKTCCQECPQKREYPASYVLDSSRRNYDDKRELLTSLTKLTLVTPSDWLARLISESFLRPFPVKVIRNGVDQTQFKPTPSTFRADQGLDDRFIVLGVASPWTARKGLKDFVALANLLGPRYAIVLVGVADEATQAGLPDEIIAIPRTHTPQDLAAIYSAADIFFNPTYEDNYPTTNIEALSCGTPVITYNTGGSPESIEDGLGFVVPKGDLQQVAQRITHVCSGLHRVPRVPQFGTLPMTNKYLALYDRALS